MSAAADHDRLPPLVAPGDPLTATERQRYSRHLLIPEVGEPGQRRLTNAKVLVLGAGGLGSPALMYLAAAGVGTLGIVDFDRVDYSNLQRQVIHSHSAVGELKTASAARRVAEINPFVTTTVHDVTLTADNALEIFEPYDLVLDGTDNFATRYLVNDACVLLGKPYVWGSIFRFEGQASLFWAKHGPQYRDVYPVPPPPGSVPSCALGGVLGVLCASIGSVMGTEAIKLICGIGHSLLGRLLVYNALEMSYRTVTIRPDPEASPVTTLIDYDEFCGTATATAKLPAEARMTPLELQREMAERDDVYLVDVREPQEHALVSIPGDVLIAHDDIVSGAATRLMPTDRPIVLYCKTGVRSGECVTTLRASGLKNVRHLTGGVLAWAEQIAPDLPQY